jgi:hypothetical protein
MSEGLIRKYAIDGKPIDVGSDWHFDLHEPGIVGRIIGHIAGRKQSEALFLMGDIFQVKAGDDSAEPLKELVEGLAERYDHIIFTPGNHDLRNRKNPWAAFADLPKNVTAPPPETPVMWERNGTKVLVANLFYDMHFIDPQAVGLSENEVLEQYAASNDGKYFLSGDLSSFPGMTEQAARMLTPDIHATATHALPHPSLITFRTSEITPRIRALAEQSGLDFIHDPDGDGRLAERWNTTPRNARTYWNIKSILMGSNLPEHPDANPRDGLAVIHGHNHRNDTRSRVIRGKSVHPVTHQMNQQDGRIRVEL